MQFPDRSINSQKEALTALAVGLGLQAPMEKPPSQPDYSQYEALLKSLQETAPQTFAGQIKSQPSTSAPSDFPFADFDLKRIQQQQQQQQQGSFKTSLEQTQPSVNPMSSTPQSRLPPGLHGFEDKPSRRMNSSPFENSSTSLFSQPQQQKSVEPMPGSTAEWRSNEQMRGVPQGNASHLFPTRKDHQERQRGDYPWPDKSPFGDRRQARQQETPTLLVYTKNKFCKIQDTILFLITKNHSMIISGRGKR